MKLGLRVREQQLPSVFRFYFRYTLHNLRPNTRCLPCHQISHRDTKGKHPDEMPACQSSKQTVGQTDRQASIMFWAVSADCSPLLPVSGLAIVAEQSGWAQSLRWS
ncbi:Solute carrier family 10 member 6 [Dissostichus eleginoides]|uniref:Solute carrier family 10 member 6 n=1 Tax=Dissostichus eleginoides TaxID=100907 RepID=A0AAD9BT02_DISEL|nr:Solute carrier family 10 member 6 [Dissostichus eleginoides]